MNDPSVIISRAKGGDLEEVLALLDSAALPGEGVAEFLGGFLVARDAAGRLVGCVGAERHGDVALLRSAAVAHHLRRSGLGSRLVAALIERARAGGAVEIALLTTTARDFFARRFGFAEAARADYEDRLAASPEWRLPRCSSAAFMRLSLRDPRGRQTD